jgi:hypothetical protein
MWEGWEAGFMAFHAFHTLSFPWPAFRALLNKPICRSRQEMLIDTHRLSLSALAIRHFIETSQVIHLSELPVLRPSEAEKRSTKADLSSATTVRKQSWIHVQ